MKNIISKLTAVLLIALLLVNILPAAVMAFDPADYNYRAIEIWGDGFFNYDADEDYEGEDSDWPVNMLFIGNSSKDYVKDYIYWGEADAPSASMSLWVYEDQVGNWTRDSDRGTKSPPLFFGIPDTGTRHMRLYSGDGTYFYNDTWRYFNVGTSHLDFAPTICGDSEDVEAELIACADSKNYETYEDVIFLHNEEEVRTQYPYHRWDNDGYASIVVVDQDTYELTMATSGDGTITRPDGNGPFPYPRYASVEIEAEGGPGWYFDYWSESAGDTLWDPYSDYTVVEMDTDKTVTANFAEVGWLSGWDERVEIAIDHTKIDDILTHFPILIHLSGSCGQSSDDLTAIFDEVGASSKKIAVTDYDGSSQLYVEVEKWDSSNEEAWLWVSRSDWDISSSQDTSLYLYFDGDHADNDAYVGTTGSAVAEHVWNNGFILVDHLQDGTASSTIDSSSYNDNGSKAAADHPQEAASKIGDGQEFDESYPDHISYAGLNLTGLSAMTLEAIVARDDMSDAERMIFSARYDTTSNDIRFKIGSTANSTVQYAGITFDDGVEDGTSNSSLQWQSGEQHLLTATEDNSTGQVILYIDGVEVARKASGANFNYANMSNSNYLGKRTVGPTSPYDGKLDEFRLSNVARSAAWTSATYYSHWDDLLEFDDEGSGWLTGWDERVEVTIDHTRIDSTLSHFPVLVHLSDSCGQSSEDLTAIFDEVGTGSKKIAVTKDDGTSQLYVEVEKWDSSNEEAWLWVSKSDWDISSSQDTSLYLYFDGDHADNDAYVGTPGSTAAEHVWDANFKLVSHMQDDPDTSHVRDSTDNDNDGSKKAAAEPAETASGFIGDAQLFDGSDDEITEDTQLFSAYPFTMSGWIKKDGNTGVAFWVGDKDTYNVFWEIFVADTARAVLRNTEQYGAIGTANVSDGQWHHVAAVFLSDTSRKIYTDGGDEQENTNTVSYSTDTDRWSIGHRARSAPEWYFDGSIDEARFSDTSRSAAWVKADYYSQRDDLLDFE